MTLGRKFLYSLFTVASTVVIVFAGLGLCALVLLADDAQKSAQQLADWNATANGEIVLICLAIVGAAWLIARPREENSDSTEAL